MRYPYYCSKCDLEVEIIKALADADNPEECDCGHVMARRISQHIGFKNEKVSENQTYFHPGLGCVVNSNSQAQRLAKERGFIEVGSDTQNSLRPTPKSYDLSDRDYHDVIGIGSVRGG